MTVIIKEGEWLTHESGEKYARALRDIETRSPVRSEDFELSDGSKPHPHTVIPNDVVRGGLIVTHACINGEWRDLVKYAVDADVLSLDPQPKQQEER